MGTEFAGRGLEYFAARVADYAGLDVVVVGGGDSAVDSANTSRLVSWSITRLHRQKSARTSTSVSERATPRSNLTS